LFFVKKTENLMNFNAIFQEFNRNYKKKIVNEEYFLVISG